AHAGTLVVNARVVPAVVDAFRQIYAARFPIRQMVPIAAYGGDDNKSMAADNTSSFNCRAAVSNGPKTWSMHAFGEAIDINTVENPYTLDGTVRPPSGKPYTNRSRVRPGMIVRGSSPTRAFSAVGWGWGGNWSSSPDYQHFSSNGK
ncbi:MAG TPA: M15 family metallopeptidase, partial [Mycobacteriales bacterium]|nr:M15 family metallopeptidase [Mycobacteriales bacterium]